MQTTLDGKEIIALQGSVELSNGKEKISASLSAGLFFSPDGKKKSLEEIHFTGAGEKKTAEWDALAISGAEVGFKALDSDGTGYEGLGKFILPESRNPAHAPAFKLQVNQAAEVPAKDEPPK